MAMSKAESLAEVAGLYWFSDIDLSRGRKTVRIRPKARIGLELRALDWWLGCTALTPREPLEELHVTYGLLSNVKIKRSDSVTAFE